MAAVWLCIALFDCALMVTILSGSHVIAVQEEYDRAAMQRKAKAAGQRGLACKKVNGAHR